MSELKKKSFDLDITLIKADFGELLGDRELTFTNGTTQKYPYRESYFSLLGTVIEE